jgi:hypothetical protein
VRKKEEIEELYRMRQKEEQIVKKEELHYYNEGVRTINAKKAKKKRSASCLNKPA